MQKLLSILLLSSLACIGTACDPGPEATILIPDEYKAYVDFSIGSWWVYEDVNDPAKRDSVYVFGELSRITQYEDIEFERISNRVAFSHNNRVDTITYRLAYSLEAHANGREYFEYLLALPAQGIMDLETLFFPNQAGDSYAVFMSTTNRKR